MVYYEDSLDVQFSLLKDRETLYQLVPVEILSDSDATKDNVIERVTSGESPSLVHFLVHGSSRGNDTHTYTHRERERECPSHGDLTV